MLLFLSVFQVGGLVYTFKYDVRVCPYDVRVCFSCSFVKFAFAINPK